MAKKPAITGLARPEGILDDVVYPIVQKAARKVGQVSFTSKKITRAAKNVERGAEMRRQLSYLKKEKKNLYKMEDKLLGDKKVNKSAAKYARKSGVAGEKGRAIWEGRPVREMAKQTRRNYK